MSTSHASWCYVLSMSSIFLSCLCPVCSPPSGPGTDICFLASGRWRIQLTEKLQDDYCSGDRFYSIEGVIDNPDQRIIQDAAEFCAAFGSVVTVFIAAPFKVAFYTWWMVSIMSWMPVGAVYAFFVIALPLQRYAHCASRFSAMSYVIVAALPYWHIPTCRRDMGIC